MILFQFHAFGYHCKELHHLYHSWLHMQYDGLSQLGCGCVCNPMFYFTDSQIRLGNKLLVYIRFVYTPLLIMCGQLLIVHRCVYLYPL